jgi:exosortase family protein XrtF
MIRTLFSKFRMPLGFILTFFLTYSISSFAYNSYLLSVGKDVDLMSMIVGNNSASLLRSFGYDSFALVMNFEKSIFIGIDGIARVKVIEGCNGISVMVLFISFLLGFPGPWRHKIWFIPAGLFAIHFINVVRVSILCLAVYSYGVTGYSIYKEVFTASIYFFVFTLWFIWVQKFGITNSM